jgi:hypothetical protein
MHKSIELGGAAILLFDLRMFSHIGRSRHGTNALKPAPTQRFTNVTGIVYKCG